MGKKGGGRNAFVKSSAINREDAIGPAEVAKGEPEASEANAEAAASDATSTPVTGVTTLFTSHHHKLLMVFGPFARLLALQGTAHKAALHNQLPLQLLLLYIMMRMKDRAR